MRTNERTRIECATLEIAQALQAMHGGRTAMQSINDSTRYYWYDIRYTQSEIFADLPGNVVTGYAPRTVERIGDQPLYV
jgi:hypothetical protein